MISGMMTHSTFILVTHSYRSHSCEKQNLLQNRLEYLRLLVIDEVFMVGSQTLFSVSCRDQSLMTPSQTHLFYLYEICRFVPTTNCQTTT